MNRHLSPPKSAHRGIFTTLVTIAVSTLVFAASNVAEAARIRQEVPFPTIDGFTTLRCDFHMHTVFSDAQVWPTIRVEEAWRDGLDVIAITDHNEVFRFKDDIPPKIGRSHEVASPLAEELGILLIRGCEVTRPEPYGHVNALFIKDNAKIRTDDNFEAVKSAAEQGAFLFWNHPRWKQAPNKPVYYPEQEDYYRRGWIKGIEIGNGPNVDNIVHGWSVQKQLTILANSDEHSLISWTININRPEGKHRPMTLVFAKEKSEEGIREALLARRTIVFANAQLFGEEPILRPFVAKCVEVVDGPVKVTKAKKGRALMLRNRSAAPLLLRFPSAVDGVRLTAAIELKPGVVTAVPVFREGKAKKGAQTVSIPCVVSNALTAPGKPVKFDLPISVVIN